ncbi:cytidylate kinase, putative [Asanoa hainanensis]|uniref:Cytidylate kinase, putative n=1 Tax=Asanoa hainanensis TaxID=560556 RepID=A0A239PFQ9_9ACTN|nr:AAA family ATPase [Asanoa hainanensis]SNT65946.1 cytidylate kinase, putative [Asanoa hainanensis]
MGNQRSITVNGDLGSGKSTVSVGLAERLHVRRISVGDLYRDMARERGMTALQLNLHAELDDVIDGTVDSMQREIAESDERVIMDSRLAWFFFTDGYKVHLITDPTVAARRVLGRPASDVENYATLEEAKDQLRSRSESERQRFLTRYHADKHALRNYDLVLDTTRARPDEVIDLAVAAIEGRIGAETTPLLLLDPARIYPTGDIGALRGMDDAEAAALSGPDALSPISIGYADSRFFVVDGHRRLSAALRAGFRLVPGTLLAQDNDPVVGGLTAREFFASTVTMSKVYDWQEAHGTELEMPAHALGDPAPVHS